MAEVMNSPPASSERGSPGTIPLGFSPQSFMAERRWEQRYLKFPRPANCRKYLRRLTSEPHIAGTAGDRHVTQFVYDEFKRDGLNPELVEYKVLLSYPKQVTVEIMAPVPVKLAHAEPAVRGDKATRITGPLAVIPWNAYSPSADITRPLIYGNYGRAEDYERLRKLGLSVNGRIVLLRYFHGYRGGKSMEAERQGAAGVLVYSDPAEDGAARGKTYPDGPWGPLGHFQRGAVVYDFLAPGDPLTPGWASTNSARRIAASDSRILPRIPMAPLSAADAREILSRLGGPSIPPNWSNDWQGGFPFPYHLGDGKTEVHMALKMENRVTPIWNVIGKVEGREEPEKLVILGNHHDAWVYGAVDPSSGTASMLETARSLGKLLKLGFRPRRTIVLGSWDAEEYTLTGSTEWGEEHETELRKEAVVCLNVDAATSGQNLSVSAVPALLPAVMEATQAVRDPQTGRSLYSRWKAEPHGENIRSYAVAGAASGPVPFGILGGGSDFMVFLQHDGVPSLDMIFDGPYGVYHSLYDDFRWMAVYGDPGFRYHATMSRLWGLLALRFADADIPPLDYAIYAGELAAYLESLGRAAPPDFARDEIQPLISRCQAWRQAATRVTETLQALRSESRTPEGQEPGDPRGALARLNLALISEERALLDPRGIPGRPWFRHLIYAPLPSYEAETIPGLREALAANDLDGAREQAKALGEAIERAIAALE
jgi:N-acetylated-alpha-linked acidic dipeptidase